jgi:site-specific DNA-methyltransferase (adenine-specific)
MIEPVTIGPCTLYLGDCIEVMRGLPDESVHCCVTSPPYWGLRDYGAAGQIGLEPTVEEFVERMVDVFEEVRRLLRPDGTCWVNLGDSYCGKPNGAQGSTGALATRTAAKEGVRCGRGVGIPRGLKPKDIVGIPWRVAFALQDAGWYLRQDIIWHKPNPMPESVRDRCTKAHEYLFLLTKSERYYWDHEAMQEPAITDDRTRSNWSERKETEPVRRGDPGISKHVTTTGTLASGTVRNKRSVWNVPTLAYPDAHFATYPPDLIKPCILAGCPVRGLVLDPFGGSGTTGQVAVELGRRAVLIELNPEYLKLAEQRTHITPGLNL